MHLMVCSVSCLRSSVVQSTGVISSLCNTGGPATAGLGAALGSSAGRGLVDALSGTQEQAEVYDQVSEAVGQLGRAGGDL